MANQYVNGTTFQLGETYEFTYNNLKRVGTVDRVGDSYVTLKLETDKDNLPYKTFAFSGITNCNRIPKGWLHV